MAKVILIILDGWGMSPIEKGNAIYQAKTPFFDYLISDFPATLLHASGQEVGLSWGEVGNSEVGHFNLGIGRVSWQSLPMIDNAIKEGTFLENKTLVETLNRAKGKTLHLVGLLSNGGVHSHINHCFALLDAAKKFSVAKVFIHAITDGRDTAAKEALGFVQETEEEIKKINIDAKIATLSGRYFAMDRDNHWDRMEKVYDAMINWRGEEAKSAEEGINAAYARGESDEFLTPTIISSGKKIENNDTVICFNYRADRSRQLTKMLVDPNFKEFKKSELKDLDFVTMTPYEADWHLNVKTIFEVETMKMSLAEILSANKMSQFHLAETEKSSHVTYFFNGGAENPFPGEKRITIPSPQVATYDLKPEMSAVKVTETFLTEFSKSQFDFSVINFANPDMVGHTGNFVATMKACEIVDGCLRKIADLVLAHENLQMIVIADHGNAEQMENPETKEADKEHTTNYVPMIAVANHYRDRGKKMKPLDFASAEATGILADLAPTILEILKIKKSDLMTGTPLLPEVY